MQISALNLIVFVVIRRTVAALRCDRLLSLF